MGEKKLSGTPWGVNCANRRRRDPVPRKMEVQQPATTPGRGFNLETVKHILSVLAFMSMEFV